MGDIVERLRTCGKHIGAVGGERFAPEERGQNAGKLARIALTAADEIESLRTEADTAFLEGVKAGLEAAKRNMPVSEWEGWGLDRLDPATITRKEPSDG